MQLLSGRLAGERKANGRSGSDQEHVGELVVYLLDNAILLPSCTHLPDLVLSSTDEMLLPLQLAVIL